MRMHSPDTTSVSWHGQQFRADAEGVFEVPAEAVADLMSHGMTIRTEPQQAPGHAAPKKPISNMGNADLRAMAAEMGISTDGLKRPELIQAVAAAMKGGE